MMVEAKPGGPNAAWSWRSPAAQGIAAVVLLAIGLHVQLTFTIAGADVRLSLSDIMTIFFLPLIFCIWWQKWNVIKPVLPYFFCAAAAATFVMSYALLLGVLRLGEIESWMLVKYLGWFALLTYCAMGMLLLLVDAERILTAFALIFVAIHVLLIAIYIVLASVGIGWYGEANPRMSGLSTNPNAYGLSLLCALSLVLAAGKRIMARFPPYMWELVSGVLISGLLFTRSLATLGALFVLLSIWLISRKSVWATLRVLIIGVVLYCLPVIGVKSYISYSGDVAPDNLSRNIAGKLFNPDDYAFSLRSRIESNARAIEMWRGAPVFGTGLGVFYTNERKLARPNRPALQIHNSALWLLVEFGVFGLAIFSVLFVGGLVFLFRSFIRFHANGLLAGDLALAGLMILPAWATMSLAHEMMYQRVPWFVAGLCAGIAFMDNSQKKIEEWSPNGPVAEPGDD